jgi:DNA (cytosine-5)-methyltransferase 1
MSDDAARMRARRDGWQKQWAVAEVFAGAGSVAHGFARAAGFEVAYLNDIDEYARRTYRVNYGRTVRYDLCDVRSVNGQTIKDAADGRPVAGLLGCPPCQGWSAAGQRVADDPRNLLLGDFFRLVAEIKPPFFVMENVPSVADRAELAAALGTFAPDYRTWHGVLNAASYGLPQSRQRTIVIG